MIIEIRDVASTTLPGTSIPVDRKSSFNPNGVNIYTFIKGADYELVLLSLPNGEPLVIGYNDGGNAGVNTYLTSSFYSYKVSKEEYQRIKMKLRQSGIVPQATL